MCVAADVKPSLVRDPVPAHPATIPCFVGQEEPGL